MCHKNIFTALDPYCASLCLEPHVNAYKTRSSLNFAAKVCPRLTLLSSSARQKANEVEFMFIFVKVLIVCTGEIASLFALLCVWYGNFRRLGKKQNTNMLVWITVHPQVL